MKKLADEYLQNPQINLVNASVEFANLARSMAAQVLRSQPYAKPIYDQMMGHAINCQTEASNVMETVGQLMAQPTPQLYQAAQRALGIFGAEVMKSSVNLTQLESLVPGASLGDFRDVLADLTQAYKYLEQEIKGFGGKGRTRPHPRKRASIQEKAIKIAALSEGLDAEGEFALAGMADLLLAKTTRKG